MVSYAPFIVIGTTGRCRSAAIANAPRLNRPTFPSRVLVPSGNITTETPFLRRSSAFTMLLCAFIALLLSMNMWPAHSHAFPTNGIFLSSFFIIHLNLLSSQPYIRNMSKML